MAYLAFKSLAARKNWLILLLISFALIISSIASIFSSTESIKINLKQSAYDQYGQFSAVLLNQSENLRDAESYGQFRIKGTVEIRGELTATAGWADEKFIGLGRLRLQSGGFPVAANEVAIESYYLKQIDSNWQLGETKELRIGDELRKYKLTGIVENYSANWSVYARKTPFPNIFVSRMTVDSDSITQYLLPYDDNKSSRSNYSDTYAIIAKNDGQGFMNEHLYNNGLKDLRGIGIISWFLEGIMLIISTVSIVTLISFFNANRSYKYGVLKSLGSTDRHLIRLQLYQTSYLFIFGTLAAIPMTVIMHFGIIAKSYGTGGILYDSSMTVLKETLLWVMFLYIVITGASLFAIKAHKNKSLGEIFNSNRGQHSGRVEQWVDEFQSFEVKQLLRQAFLFPKRTILSYITMGAAILVILIAGTYAKEASGIWTTDIDYYLSSQEDILSKEINQHPVLVSKDVTYPTVDVQQLQSIKEIALIDKVPSMLDVLPIMKQSDVPSTLRSRVGDGRLDISGNNDVVIKNVNYVLDSDDDWKGEIQSRSFVENLPLIVLYCPDIKSDEIEALIGKKVTLSKSTLKESGDVSEENWDFIIARVINKPYEKSAGGAKIQKQDVTFVLQEQYALQNGITKGYRDLTIYTLNNLTETEKQNVYERVLSLATGTPGGVFQYIPNVIHDERRISNLLNLLSYLTFFVSTCLSFISIYIVIYGKYQLHRRYWGIYRSLGMRLNRVHRMMSYEIVGYFFGAALLSSVLYTFFLFMIRPSYPLTIYFRFLGVALVVVLLLLLLVTMLIKNKIGKDSIAALLKLDE
ncbi:putative ABC transport system permease protein [Paenibacillus cellulosilyticus]|uniref:Putative ABC transport system permease protein n=1 Tax=Paenibacillus cellulosilyticus TaxID=375489 RepID=A0A2V2YS30_9BACL|nr:FtsX-like permease family protein [Paenibacillus cellulosilyticus]PWW00870.1 putative ABC transport system permease protein [Paenibacillus cellulosilyticus]QKS47531.1 FtsX-like permease family protein [Paenibacillus cellulosilyticus]